MRSIRIPRLPTSPQNALLYAHPHREQRQPPVGAAPRISATSFPKRGRALHRPGDLPGSPLPSGQAPRHHGRACSPVGRGDDLGPSSDVPRPRRRSTLSRVRSVRGGATRRRPTAFLASVSPVPGSRRAAKRRNGLAAQRPTRTASPRPHFRGTRLLFGGRRRGCGRRSTRSPGKLAPALEGERPGTRPRAALPDVRFYRRSICPAGRRPGVFPWRPKPSRAPGDAARPPSSTTERRRAWRSRPRVQGRRDRVSNLGE